MPVPTPTAHRNPALLLLLLTVTCGLATPSWALDLPPEPTPGVAPSGASTAAEPLSAATAPEAPAQEPAELVIEGRRTVPTGAFSLDRSVHTVDRQRLAEIQPESTAAAVASAPGTFGQVTNRGAGSPLLRGLIGPQNLILIEGLRLNTATFRTGPNQYLATIDPSAIARVEVLLGPGGVMYGSDAMGGVIGLYLPPLPILGSGTGPTARLWTQYGTVDATSATGVQGSWTAGPLALEAGGGWRAHGTLATGQGTSALASDFRQWGWHARAALRLPGPWTAQATVLHNAVIGAGRTDDLGKGNLRTADNTDLFGWLQLQRATDHGLLRHLRLALVAHRLREDGQTVRCTLVNKLAPSLSGCATAGQLVARDSPEDLPAGVTRHDQAIDEVLALGALATARLALLDDRLKLTIGAEAWLDQVDASARTRTNGSGTDSWQALARGNYSTGSSYLQAGGFSHLDWTLWSTTDWSVVVNAGGRGGLVSAQAVAVPVVGDVSYSLPIVATTAGVVLQRTDTLSIFGNYSTGLRAPNLQETTVLGNTGVEFEVPNADLGAERITATEVGMRVRAGGFSGLLSGFHSVVSEFIDRETVKSASFASYGIDAADLGCAIIGDTNCKPVSRRVNLGTATIVGAELAVRGPKVAGVHPWLAGSWLKGETSAAGLTQPLRRAPPPVGSFGLRWSGHNAAAYVEPWLRAAAAQDQLNTGDTKDLRICEDPLKPGTVLATGLCTGTAGWMTVNLRAGYRWDGEWPTLRTLRLDVDAGNLLDARYRIHGSGVDAAGRGVTATLSAQW